MIHFAYRLPSSCHYWLTDLAESWYVITTSVGCHSKRSCTCPCGTLRTPSDLCGPLLLPYQPRACLDESSLCPGQQQQGRRANHTSPPALRNEQAKALAERKRCNVIHDQPKIHQKQVFERPVSLATFSILLYYYQVSRALERRKSDTSFSLRDQGLPVTRLVAQWLRSGGASHGRRARCSEEARIAPSMHR